MRLLCALICLALSSLSQAAELSIRPMPKPRDAVDSIAAIAYGQALAFDKRLSATRTHSCMTCHEAERAYTDNKALSDGATNRTANNAPTLLNAGYKIKQFHNGRADLLEGQAGQPLVSVVEMGQDNLNSVARRIAAIPGYQQMALNAFGRNVNAADMLKAIAAFERTLVSTNAPVDRMLSWEFDAQRNVWLYEVLPAARWVGDDNFRKGFDVFINRGCIACHLSPDYRDGNFYNVGFNRPGTDRGRAQIVGGGAIRGFATPTLREVQATAPYGERGQYSTLAAVVAAHCDPIQDNQISQRVAPFIGLSAGEQASLVSFLEVGFKGTYPIVSAPVLPPDTAESLAVFQQETQQDNDIRRGLFRRRR